MFASIQFLDPQSALRSMEKRLEMTTLLKSSVCLCTLVGWILSLAGHWHLVCEVKPTTQVRLMTAEDTFSFGATRRSETADGRLSARGKRTGSAKMVRFGV